MRHLASLFVSLFLLLSPQPAGAAGGPKDACKLDYDFITVGETVYVLGTLDCSLPNGFNVVLKDSYNGTIDDVLEYTDHPVSGAIREYDISLTQWNNSKLVIRGNK